MKNFRWKDQENNSWNPKDMETRHLFYTLKMIWNHVAPEELKINPYMEYRFSSYYTTEYIMNAVSKLGEELVLRKDVFPAWVADIEYMANNVNKVNQLLLGVKNGRTNNIHEEIPLEESGSKFQL